MKPTKPSPASPDMCNFERKGRVNVPGNILQVCTYLNDVLQGVDIVSFGLDKFAHDEQQCSEGGSEVS